MPNRSYNAGQPADSAGPVSAPSDAVEPYDPLRTTNPGDSWVPPPPDAPLSGVKALSSRFALRNRVRSDDDADADGTERITEHGLRGNDLDPHEVEIPGFVILRECGRGGMGVVYLAEQVHLGRQVAIKFLKPELAASEGQRARFLAEARALARLQHPNIVQVFDSGESGGRFYIIEEFVAAGDLYRRLARQPQPPRVAAGLVATLARAVDYAHQQHIIHRDLKPSNVLMTEDGVPKISDFGLAKQFGEDGGSSQTQTGTIIGSPSYMAPEQADDPRKSVSPGVDVYALGAILYEAVTGRPPFLAASMLETLEQVRTADPVPPHQLQPGLPRDIETICLKCLAKDPARRYASAIALSEDLDRYLQGHSILARPASPAERAAKWVRRHPATATGFSIAVLAAIALFIGGAIYQTLLRSALKQAKASATLARDQQKRADRRYNLAREALNRMLDRLGDRRLAQSPRLKELRRQQLEDALGFYRSLVTDRVDQDEVVQFDAAQAYLHLGLMEHKLGRTKEGDGYLLQAAKLLEVLSAKDPKRADYRIALARSYRAFQAVSGLKPPPGVSQQEYQFMRAGELFKELIREAPTRIDYRREMALNQNSLAVVYSHQNKLVQAEKFYKEAIELYRATLSPTPSNDDIGARIELADALRNLAVVTQQQAHATQAPTYYAESRKLLAEVLAVDPNWDEAKIALAGSLYNWAIFVTANPKSRDEAGPLLDEAIDQLKPIVDREPDWALARGELLNAHGARAQLRELQGRQLDAAHDWDYVIALATPGVSQEQYQFLQAITWARAGEHAKAWKLVKVLEPSLPRRGVNYVVHLATVCGVAANGAQSDAKLSQEDRAKLATLYGDKAVALFRQALDLLSAEDREVNFDAWQANAEMAALQRRTDFQELLPKTQAQAAVTPVASPAPHGNK